MKYLLNILWLVLPHTVMAQCEHPDYAGLMAFYDATNGNNWEINAGWKEAKEGTACDPCDFNGNTWFSITCTNGRVTRIFMSSNNLRGEIPDMALSELQRISISNSPFLTGLANFQFLPKLEEISISRCGLIGDIPDFSNTPLLSDILLRSNDLVGSIPNFNLPNLKRIDVRGNELTGGVPLFENLIELVDFDCSDNEMTGSFHNFQSSPKMRSIFCERNNFNGALPDFGDHDNVNQVVFFASSNDFSGCYPESTCDLGGIEFTNNPKLPFRGEFSRICTGDSYIGAPCSPEEYESFGILDEDCNCVPIDCDYYKSEVEELLKFYVSTNGPSWTNNAGWNLGLQGSSCFPCDNVNRPWYGVICLEGKVAAIDLDGDANFAATGVGGNNLTGTIPDLQIGSLKALYLDDNHLSGDLPTFLGMPELEHLVISRNNFEGALPDFNNLKNLKVFRGSYNAFSGVLPDISNLDSLRTFSCSDNLLNGCYPDSICNVNVFDITNNELLPWSGELDAYCNGENQIGAPCNLSLDEDYVINDNCECVSLISNVDETFSNMVTLYPNPASEYIQINTEIENPIFRIYNQDSKQVLLTRSSLIDLKGLSNGVYFIRMNAEKASVLKFVKI